MLMQEFETFNYRFDSKLRPYIHSHSANEIYYFHSGKCQYLLSGDLFELAPGDLIVMNGIREHGPIADDAEQYIRSTLMFESKALRSLSLIPGMVDVGKPFQVSTYYRWSLQGEQKEEFELLLHELHKLHHMPTAVAMNRCNLKFYELLLFVYSRFEETGDMIRTALSDQEQLIHRTMFYVDQHFMEELSAEDIAACMHVSKSYLMKQFKKYTHETLFDYITKRRISQAKLYFNLHPGDTVTDVCYRSGFKDASHFSRTFKRLTGLAPEAYRRLIRRLDSHSQEREETGHSGT